ncbi:MAG: hypothetical protein M3336_18225, partial [Chloroflexota bacterium]|nr:hypothetical protein [Chloroflexota bacterium]
MSLVWDKSQAGAGTDRVSLDSASAERDSHKADRPLPARELYVSPLFRAARAYPERCYGPDHWLILSARHRLVDPETVLAPYDLSLRQLMAAEREARGDPGLGGDPGPRRHAARSGLHLSAGRRRPDDLEPRLLGRQCEPLLWAAPWLWRLSGNVFLDRCRPRSSRRRSLGRARPSSPGGRAPRRCASCPPSTPSAHRQPNY